MYMKINPGLVFVSITTFTVLLFSNISEASGYKENFNRTVYEPETLHHSSPHFSKVSSSRFYSSRYNNFRYKRNFYRGNRYYRSGNLYNRGNRFYRSNRFDRFHNRNFNKRYIYRYR